VRVDQAERGRMPSAVLDERDERRVQAVEERVADVAEPEVAQHAQVVVQPNAAGGAQRLGGDDLDHARAKPSDEVVPIEHATIMVVPSSWCHEQRRRSVHKVQVPVQA
jgi:hypothetical protein